MLISGVARPGESLRGVEVSTNRSWRTWARDHGSVVSRRSGFAQHLSFRLTARLTGERVTFMNCFPAGWSLGTTRTCGGNFRTSG